MGSHGGGTAEGQREVLAKLRHHRGVRRRAGPRVHGDGQLGTTPKASAGLDKHAAEADTSACVARVKPHTGFDGPVESGLLKMMMIGLGKHAGAQNVHHLGPRGYTEVRPALARIAIGPAPIAFGLALVENADERR